MFIPDAYDQWEAHERQLQRELERLPICIECDEHIQDEEAYYLNGDWICECCMSAHKKTVEDYIE